METSKIIDRNACAYKEIFEILKIFPKELVSKIPKEKILFFRNNMDRTYKYDISVETFDGTTMLDETKAILTILFRDYWATEKQKAKIEAYENAARNELQEEEARIKYNANDLFKNQNNIEKYEPVEETALVEYKESFVKKIINKILLILKLR